MQNSEHKSALRLFYVSRSLDRNGDGVITTDELFTAIKAFGITGYANRSRTMKILRNSVGVFFHYVDKDRIEYAKPERVAEALGTTVGKIVEVPTATMKTVRTASAAFYTSFYGDHKGVRITRDRVSDMFGISKSQQRRHERLAGVKKEPNWVHAAEGMEHDKLPLPYDKERDQRVGFKDSAGRIWWQTANTYFGQYGAFLNKSVRIANKNLRESSCGADDGGGADSKKVRVFFKKVTGKRSSKRGCFIFQGVKANHTGAIGNVWQYSEWTPAS